MILKVKAVLLSGFFEHPRETQIGLKNWVVFDKSRVKSQSSTEGKETTFAGEV